jgi:hypothetical protein
VLDRPSTGRRRVLARPVAYWLSLLDNREDGDQVVVVLHLDEPFVALFETKRWVAVVVGLLTLSGRDPLLRSMLDCVGFPVRRPPGGTALVVAIAIVEFHTQPFSEDEQQVSAS